jgi:type IV secretory pathway TraG/TraD family ATPase VirD4
MTFYIVFGVVLLIFIVAALSADRFTKFNFRDDIEEIKQPKNKQVRATEEIHLGKNGLKAVTIPTNAKHVGIFGTTGSGKTVALGAFISSGIEYGYPQLIVDGKGDTDEGSLLDIVNILSGQQKKYIINLNDPEASDKYNPFKNTTPTVIKDMLINLTEWSEEHYKKNTERFLQRLINLLVKAEVPTSLKNIIEYMDGNRFIDLSHELQKNGVLTKAQHTANLDLLRNSEEIVNGAVARFTTLYESDIGQIFDDDGIDIYTALKEKAIILFILNPLLYPETSPLFGNLIVIDSKKAISRLFKNKPKRAFFIFDEVGSYARETILDLVNKSRSANATCILATQSPSDLDAKAGEHFTEQVIENCNNYIFLRQNSAKNAERLANIIGTRNSMDMTYQVTEEGSTGLGSARRTREFLYHPDEIKAQKIGEAIFVSKDNGFHTRVKIDKCF